MPEGDSLGSQSIHKMWRMILIFKICLRIDLESQHVQGDLRILK